MLSPPFSLFPIFLFRSFLFVFGIFISSLSHRKLEFNNGLYLYTSWLYCSINNLNANSVKSVMRSNTYLLVLLCTLQLSIVHKSVKCIVRWSWNLMILGQLCDIISNKCVYWDEIWNLQMYKDYLVLLTHLKGRKLTLLFSTIDVFFM